MRGRLLTGVLMVSLTGGAPALAYWNGASEPGGRGGAAATTVPSGGTPTVSPTGSSVAVTWAARTLADGQPVGGYLVRRYDATTLVPQTTGTGCSGTRTGTTCTETSVPDGRWRYTVTPVVGANWRGAESTKSAQVLVDVTAPSNALTLSSVSGGATRSGSTVYYRGAVGGSLRLTNALSDATSGPAGSTTSALSGVSTGWTHTPSTTSTPAGGPYESATFTWAAGTTSAPSVTVTGADQQGNTAVTALGFVDDSLAPSAGTVSSTDGYVASRSVSVSLAPGSDTGSGVATTQLQRASALLSGGSCGTFGSYVDLGSSSATSPYVDTDLANSTCYRYRIVVTDRVGNATTTTGGDVAKVDYAHAVAATSGLVGYWRLGDARSWTTTTSDSISGTAGSTLQSRSGEVGASWTRHSISDADALLTAAGEIRKAGTNTRAAIYYSSGVPASADYTVSADLHMLSDLAVDHAGVVGRVNPAAATFYAAVWESEQDRWALYSLVNQSPTLLGSSTQLPLTPGTSARVQLDMSGSTIRLLVKGTQLVSVTNTAITSAGRAGVSLGGSPSGAQTTVTDTTGVHLDNVGVLSGGGTAADATGPNSGSYRNGTALASVGALGADADRASSFDGLDDHVQATTTTGFPTGSAARSAELFFRTSDSGRQTLFSYGSRVAQGQEFGLWLNAGGTALTAWGYGTGYDKTFTLSSAVNDGAWHHVVQTYDGSQVTLYVDGVALAPQSVALATGTDSYGLGIGAVLNPAGTVSYGGFFRGELDELSLYSVALTPAQVSAHHRLGTGR